MTAALAERLTRLIARDGPLTVARYMAEALAHPEHGYYMTRDPLGRAGDFITAPEVSQMFGELIGLWAAALWQAMGSPPRLALVELGPGRGTLMADALRALKVAPGLLAAVSVHLVEISPALRAKQRQTLGHVKGIVWHDDTGAALAAAGKTPTLIIANEFFDALPIHQLVRTPKGWRERTVTVDDKGNFAFALDPRPTPLEALIPAGLKAAVNGAVMEVSPASLAVMGDIAAHLAEAGGAALIIDYGHDRPGHGDTLQALKGHVHTDALHTPGEADITAHVDFAALAEAARQKGAHIFGPITQGVFLETLGITARAERLMAASPAHAADIKAAYQRLTAADAMGTLFKALAIASPGLTVPGFPS